ncbi:hypothetical protein [Photobacterium lipolyticum]|uniref:Uncharacterized protein n=1 Tax=Photobacterium lipolyticum TaxID=266810 RepID=A0A2T3N1S0_9GAMM|nr:hypothetical protein [Photobacterium lipolyticum]PSW06175.1 hypothetical protein C9I89_06610 [Photobacterium lipolyticum]
MDITENKRVIHNLNFMLRELDDIIFNMRVGGITEGLDDLEERRKLLAEKIDELIVNAMKEWQLEGASITAKLSSISDELVQAEKDIDQIEDTAKNVTKVIGLIDDILVIVAKIAILV